MISDTHLGHANILTYCSWRQSWASSLAEHDAAIIAAWRAYVQPTDWVLHLGDVALGPKEALPGLRQMLPGRIIVVRGNHDRSAEFMRQAGFDLVCSSVRIEDDQRHWIARHNPASFSTQEADAAALLLHGHCHGNGLDNTIVPVVRAKARDCSLDALKSVSPVAWETVVSAGTPLSC